MFLATRWIKVQYLGDALIRHAGLVLASCFFVNVSIGCVSVTLIQLHWAANSVLSATASLCYLTCKCSIELYAVGSVDPTNTHFYHSSQYVFNCHLVVGKSCTVGFIRACLLRTGLMRAVRINHAITCQYEENFTYVHVVIWFEVIKYWLMKAIKIQGETYEFLQVTFHFQSSIDLNTYVYI